MKARVWYRVGDFDRIIQNEPSAIDLRMMRAQVHIRAKTRKALLDIEAVLNLNPIIHALKLQDQIRQTFNPISYWKQ